MDTRTRELNRPLTELRGVGPKIAARLTERGLSVVEDLLFFLPLEYQDRRRVTRLEELTQDTPATTRGEVVQIDQRGRPRNRVVTVGLGPARGEPAALSCVWFRAHPGVVDQFHVGQRLLVSGAIKIHRGALQMAHPDFWPDPDGDLDGGIHRRYPTVEKVSPKLIARICGEACARFACHVQDALPRDMAATLGLPSQADALNLLHLVGDAVGDPLPDPAEVALLQRGQHAAQRRLVLDELFSLQVAVCLERARWSRRAARPCVLTGKARRRLDGRFPFRLTGAQQRVIEEILGDLGRPHPMHRLVQGDVGSGKTALAFAAAWAVIERGYQAAIMAPTEILAQQHFRLMERWIRPRRAALVTRGGSLSALPEAGEIDLFIGTHALLSPKVRLKNLALAVIDEQHRFGVLQRFRLRDRPLQQPVPHLLLMTATPIPRSLALAMYGDLDLSVLDEKPPGRRPPTTELCLGARGRRLAYDLVGEQLDLGRQAFVVCPLVEESARLEAADAVSTRKELLRRFPGRRVGLAHGQMPAAERDEALGAFREGATDLMVATTVIEVGIDVPDVAVMVVEGAERFGLAQLHQLRGRIGRGSAASRCLLLSGVARTSDAGERLALLTRTDDGFEIAEADLERRGPGAAHGTLQAGAPRLRFADLDEHRDLAALAGELAAAVVARDPTLSRPEHEEARRAMSGRWAAGVLAGAEAG